MVLKQCTLAKVDGLAIITRVSYIQSEHAFVGNKININVNDGIETGYKVIDVDHANIIDEYMSKNAKCFGNNAPSISGKRWYSDTIYG